MQLKCVVEHFVSMKSKVLVLGRKHMTKWKAEDMQIVYDNADIFFAEDMWVGFNRSNTKFNDFGLKFFVPCYAIQNI